jgi:hypothetical protein
MVAIAVEALSLDREYLHLAPSFRIALAIEKQNGIHFAMPYANLTGKRLM